MSKQLEDKVGYKNPPEHTRFKKGQSGNPHGRPKGSGTIDWSKAIDRQLSKTIVAQDGTKMKMYDVIAMRQVHKAAKGDYKAADLLMRRQVDNLDPKQGLSPILDSLRLMHAKHVAADSAKKIEKEDHA